MSEAAQISKRLVSKTEAHYENRVSFGLLDRFIKEGRIGVNLINGKIMLDADEVVGVVQKYRNRVVVRQTLFD